MGSEILNKNDGGSHGPSRNVFRQLLTGRQGRRSGHPRPALVFGVLLDDPSEDWPGRNRMMRSLSKEFDVFYLRRERRPWPRLPRVEELRSHEFVITGAFWSSGSRRLKRLQFLFGRLDAWLFNTVLERSGHSTYCFWLATPQPELIRYLSPRLLVFDCMDPCLTAGLEDDFDRRERESALRADVVFASAASLERRMRALGTSPIRLPNGAAVEDIDGDMCQIDARVALGIATERVAAFLGTIDSRVDIEFLREVIDLLPGWMFLLGGRVNHDREGEMQTLLSRPNLRVLGQISNHQGRELIAAADVCLIPFRVGAVGDAINPVKMYSYLASGKPVVATDIEECRANPFVVTAADAGAMARAIETAASNTDLATTQARRAFAHANTWDVRAKTAAQTIRTLLHAESRT